MSTVTTNTIPLSDVVLESSVDHLYDEQEQEEEELLSWTTITPDENSEDVSQDFFQSSAFNLDWKRMSIAEAVDRVYTYNIPMSLPFPLRQSIVNELSKLKIFTLGDFIQCRYKDEKAMIQRLLTTRFVFNQNPNSVLNSGDILKLKLHSINLLFFELTQLMLVRPVINALQFKNYLSDKKRILSFGDEKIDQLLGGGLRTRSITELWGASGSGKTQICMQLLSMAVSPTVIKGMEGRALYLCSESNFPTDRLQDIIEQRLSELQIFKQKQVDLKIPISEDLGSIKEPKDLMDRILFCQTRSIPEFKNAIETDVIKQCELAEGNIPVSLIIIDSITALFRTEEVVRRSVDLGYVANKLRLIADRYNLCVFIVNQVTDDFPKVQNYSLLNMNKDVLHTQMSYEAVLYSDPALVCGNDKQDETLRAYRRRFYLTSLNGKTRKKPALGLAWSFYVNMSLMCSKNENKTRITVRNENNNKKQKTSSSPGSSLDHIEQENERIEVVLRQLHVIFAPHLKNGSQTFIIERQGLKSIDI